MGRSDGEGRPARSVAGRRAAGRLEIGQSLEGAVKEFVDEGAILDLGLDKPAILHVNQMFKNGFSAELAEDFFSLGERLKVRVARDTGKEIEVTMNLKLKGASDFKLGAEVNGTVRGFKDNTVLVDIGAVVRATLPRMKLGDKVLTEGQCITAKIEEIDVFNGFILSLEASPTCVIGQTLEGIVKEFNSRGAILDVGMDKLAFLHLDQIQEERPDAAQDVLSVGQRLEVRVCREDVSQIEVTSKGKHLKGASDFKVGEDVEGVVLGFLDSLLFVDVGAVCPAFLPRETPGEGQFVVGQLVNVTIEHMDALSGIELTWAPICRIGQQLKGTVMKFSTDGQSALLDVGLAKPALLRTSTLIVQKLTHGERKRPRSVKEALVVGQLVEVRVLMEDASQIEVTTRGNHLKGASNFTVGQEVKGPVVGVSPLHGIFVDIGGLKHALLPRDRLRGASFEEGELVKATIAKISSSGILLSFMEKFTGVRYKMPWCTIGQTLTGTVEEFSLCGAILDVGLRKPAFLHARQLSEQPALAEDVLVLGQKLIVRVLQELPNEIQVTMRGKHLKGAAAFKVGEVVEGTVLVVRQYEAFVDIGALTSAFLSIRMLGHCKFWQGQSIKVKITELHGRQIKLKLEEA